jgi:hypothetical protein
MTQEIPAVYFASLSIENINCFKEKKTIYLLNGNNNTGKILSKIKEVLICGILPDVQDFDIDNTDDFQFFIKFKTDYGWVKLSLILTKL